MKILNLVQLDDDLVAVACVKGCGRMQAVPDRNTAAEFLQKFGWDLNYVKSNDLTCSAWATCPFCYDLPVN